ncbi:MAG: NADH kinase pos5 [Alyxoria varia]|nr:MAG: NADH kinase pos5 [Alyxoria varia]
MIRARPRHTLNPIQLKRSFSSTSVRLIIRDISDLPEKIQPTYQETRNNDLLSLHWPSPPRNILLLKKDHEPGVTESFLSYIRHLHSSYSPLSIILEPHVAAELHESLDHPVFTYSKDAAQLPSSTGRDSTSTIARTPHHTSLPAKVDLTSTLGGDGTILRAASLFAHAPSVPPILAFSMGTLGFLGEWKFHEHKRAFREVYVSGAEAALQQREGDRGVAQESERGDWSQVRGKIMGSGRNARVLLRNRLKASIHNSRGGGGGGLPNEGSGRTMHALNELILHRGSSPHLAHLTISLGHSPPRHLTTTLADGLILSTPTGSTAYSLSSGGSIIHPLVNSLLITPICPRSLSFRPLVLPAGTVVWVGLESSSRMEGVEVSVDGVRIPGGLEKGGWLRVGGEEMVKAENPSQCVDDSRAGSGWTGGVPCIVRPRGGARADGEPVGGDAAFFKQGSEDSWVGGLNSLLKFNYPMGEEDEVNGDDSK